MLINHFLENSAQRHPDKPAAWQKNEWITYGELDLLADKLANYLRGSDVRKGDRVGILLENSFNYVISYFAVLKAGAITVALNTMTTADALSYALNDSGAKAIIADGKFSRHLLPALRQCPDLKEVIVEGEDLSGYEQVGHCNPIRLKDAFDQGSGGRPAVRCIDIDVASIVYTSGSTGRPKGVTHTHLNVVSNTHSIAQYLKLTEHDRVMVVLPLYYIYGQSLLTTHFCVGGSIVLDNRFAYPQVILETMKKTQVTGFSGVPSTFLILLDKSTVRECKIKSLRYATQAGGAMAPAVQQEVAEVFAPARLFIMYGATEAAPRLSYVEPEMLPEKWGSIGKAIPNVELLVVDENGCKLGPNQTGEIVARGSNIMAGYWNDPAATAEVLRNGWYYTGDLGKTDDDDYLYVVGRKKDIIKTGGFRVSAQEVEEALLEIDTIHEAAVLGVDDPILGEAIKAFIVFRGTTRMSEEDIAKALIDRLAPYKHPKYYETKDRLPKNQAGKVLKTVLKQEQQAG